MADHILGVDGPSVTIPTGVAPVGGLALGDQDSNWLFADNPITLTAGTNVLTTLFTSALPSWYASGQIITPGLYLAGFTVRPPASMTGTYLTVQSPLNGYFAIPIDGLVALGQQWVAKGFVSNTRVFMQPDTTVLGATDVPFNIDWDFFVTSGGPTLSVTPYLQRLVYPT